MRSKTIPLFFKWSSDSQSLLLLLHCLLLICGRDFVSSMALCCVYIVYILLSYLLFSLALRFSDFAFYSVFHLLFVVLSIYCESMSCVGGRLFPSEGDVGYAY